MKRIAIISLLLFFTCRLFPQNSNFYMRHLTVGNGLPSGITNDISWDSNGFLWISTLKGIARFDGLRMRSFPEVTNPSQEGGYVSPLSTDDDGKTIYCDGINNIFGFRDNEPVLLDSAYRVSLEGGNHFALPLPRRFWRPVLMHYSDMFAHNNTPVVVDGDHFVMGYRDTLLQYDRLSNQYVALQHFAGAISLFKMGDELYIYEADRSFYRLSARELNQKPSIEPVKVSFTLQNTKIYWSNGMEAGILVEGRRAYLLHLRQGVFTKELICDELPNDIFIKNIKYNASTQTTVIASDGDGIYLYEKKLLRSYIQRTPGILSRVYSFYSQFECEPDQLWLDQGRVLNEKTNQYYTEKGHPLFKSVYSLKDSLALFHVISGADPVAVACYSYKTRKFITRFGTPHTSSGAFAMTENRLFFADDNGMTEMSDSRDSAYISFSKLAPNTISMVRDMKELRPGYLLICGEIGVFGVDIHTKKIDKILPKNTLHTFRQITLYKGYVFLAQYGSGIWVMKNGTARLLPLDKNQYLRWVSNLFVDKDNNAWIAANAGILKTNADSLLSDFNSVHNDLTFYLKCDYYGKNDGMEVSELNGGRQGSMIQLRNGSLSYTGINGVVNVDIASRKTPSFQTKIVVDKLLANNREIPRSELSTVKTFDPNTADIKIFFSVPVWTDPGNVLMQYRLAGNHDQWEEFDYTKQDYISLTNLPAGAYTFEMRVSPVVDRSHPAKFSFSFVVAAPWYRTWLSIFLFVLAGLLLVAGFFRWRLYYLRQRNKILQQQVATQVEAINEQNTALEAQKVELQKQITEMAAYQKRLEKDYALKNRLISIIGHDIITPLRFMNRAGKSLLTKKENISQATFNDTLKTIVATGTGLQDMAGNMLNWIKHHHETMEFNLSEFELGQKINEIVQSIKPMAEFKQLIIRNEIPSGMTICQYGDPVKTIILQLLTNSIKFSETGTITTFAEFSDGEVRLFVKDEGIGMSQRMANQLVGQIGTSEFADFHEESGHGFGFLIIRDMLESIQGRLQIESVLKRGTTVTIHFPARRM